jgi:hypothetical protein
MASLIPTWAWFTHHLGNPNEQNAREELEQGAVHYPG